MAVFTDEGKTYHVRVGKGDIGRPAIRSART